MDNASIQEGVQMKFRWLSRLGLSVSLVVVLLATASAFAQSSDDQVAQKAFAGAFLIVFLIVGLAAYIYFGLALQTIAQKTGTQNAWLAWIPLINVFLMLDIAKKPMWWFLLFLIPIVNLVMGVIVWMGVATARKKPEWWGILSIVPLVNLVVPGYLAWSD
jgi:hypothetical protein